MYHTRVRMGLGVAAGYATGQGRGYTGNTIKAGDDYTVNAGKYTRQTKYEPNNILNLICTDRGGKTVFEKKDLVKNKKIVEIPYLYLAFSKNNTCSFLLSFISYLIFL